MTGFAAVSREDAAGRVQLTLRSVNHRFLDVLIKAPSVLAETEARVRTLLQQGLVRGRVEVSISIDLIEVEGPEVTLDEVLLSRIGVALQQAREKGLVTGELTASDVVRIPHVLEIKARASDRPPRLPEAAARLVEQATRDAIDALVAMRETEGRFLETDLSGRIATLDNLVDELERLGLAGQRDTETRLKERVSVLPVDLQTDPAALAQEVVRFVARSDVAEEIVRLRGHLGHWRQLAEGPEPCGRKLDFLVQEMNRELNTIGAKIEGGRATESVIAAKAELERVREQVQNVE